MYRKHLPYLGNLSSHRKAQAGRRWTLPPPQQCSCMNPWICITKGKCRTRKSIALCPALSRDWKLAPQRTARAVELCHQVQGALRQITSAWMYSASLRPGVHGAVRFSFVCRKGIEGQEVGSRQPTTSLNDWETLQISVPRFLSGEIVHLAPECSFSIWLGRMKCRISLLNCSQLHFLMMKLSS